MKRKEFIKRSTLMVAGSMLVPYSATPLNPGNMTQNIRKNWAGNYQYKAPNLYLPGSAEEVSALVKMKDPQKALGSRHCFNNIADSPNTQISLQKLSRMLEVDKENRTVTVEGGARYGDFCEALDQQGFALHNLASLPHITATGACATATHGSGVGNGNLATAVSAVELVTPSGDIVTINREHQDFNAVVVGLGAFGIITKIKLNIEPSYQVRQDIFQELPVEMMADHFDEIMSAGYSVSLFTDWRYKKVSQVWIKRRMDQEISDLGDEYYGARAADRNLHPIVALSAENCTEQMGVPGPWWNRLPHFKMGFTPSGGEELQSEFFIPRENAVDAYLAIEKMSDEIYPHLLISEIRTIKADEFWMSPCYQQDSVAIHYTWKQQPAEVKALISRIEAELEPYGVKPHWGKLFSVDPVALRERYERYEDFLSLARNYDPEGKFRNAYLDKNIYPV